jgi:hypothetical protein
MYWATSLGIGLLLNGAILIVSGQYAVSAHSENQEMCTSIIGQGVQFFSDDVNQSCDKVNIYVQFGNIMTIAGIVMAVIGGSSMIVGSVIRDKKLTKQNTDYY